MYSNEAKGKFPDGTRWAINGNLFWANGVDGGQLFPEYWTDPAIMICPSDTRSDATTWFTSGLGLQDDLAEQVQNITGADEISQRIRSALLSHPISYMYIPYAVSSMSQVMDVMIGMAQSAYTTVNPSSGWVVGATNAEIVDRNGPSQWTQIVDFARVHGWDSLPASEIRGGDDFWRDDDSVTLLPSSYHKLREGIERFFITDINNPAATASAQSELPVLYDAWATHETYGSENVGTARFNHVPGGSNVLFMDGHVEFARYPSAMPCMYNGVNFVGNTVNFSSQSAFWMGLLGGVG